MYKLQFDLEEEKYAWLTVLEIAVILFRWLVITTV